MRKIKKRYKNIKIKYAYVNVEKNILTVINYDTKNHNFIKFSLILVVIPTPLLLHSLNLFLRRFYPIR